jgi:hypothetical protein
MGFFDLDGVRLVGAAGADADYVAKRTRADLLNELVLALDLLLHRQHAWEGGVQDVL